MANRITRVLVGAALFATWVLTGAAPWIADEVMPDYHHGEAVPYQPAVVEAYADQVAREAILAGVLSLMVFALCLWLMFGGPRGAKHA